MKQGLCTPTTFPFRLTHKYAVQQLQAWRQLEGIFAGRNVTLLAAATDCWRTHILSSHILLENWYEVRKGEGGVRKCCEKFRMTSGNGKTGIDIWAGLGKADDLDSFGYVRISRVSLTCFTLLP